MNRIHIYDTTLRDGTQGEGFQLSVDEKLKVARLLDDLGVDWIEGGWPGSNPRDAAFFERARLLDLRHARMTAFGSTRRASRRCADDPSLQALIAAEVPTLTIFGKAWRLHATDVLHVSPEQNLELIRDTVAYLKGYADELIFDAEHFFDGAADDEEYALAALAAAAEGGADWLVLCDTNGGTLPDTVRGLTERVAARFGVPVGVHCHNDAELAVANSMAAVAGGATMVQGTVNGYGERCGNANLCSILPNLELKMGRPCLPEGRLKGLTHVAHLVDEMANNVPLARQPWVGRSAFAHKGGVHVHAVMKSAVTYEHADPEAVGNERRILVSDLSGRSNILAKAEQFGVDLDPDDPTTRAVLDRIKRLEHEGFQFEGAEASLELLMEEARGRRPRWFEVREAVARSYVVGWGERSEALLRLVVEGEQHEVHGEGNGPVDAMGRAFKDVLVRHWPVLAEVRLVDYKVRILDGSEGVGATVRVLVTATDGEDAWSTVGVSTNVVEASWQALVDAFEYRLLKAGVEPHPETGPKTTTITTTIERERRGR
ncbi:MAG: citramalate synthase [Myxococcota bacterium]